MATLQAIVDIQDKASAKFTRMTATAKSFEEQLERVSRKLTEVEAKMAALSRMKVSMRVSLDTSAFDAQLAALVARTKAVSMMDVNIGADGPGGFGMPRVPNIMDDMNLGEVAAKVVDRQQVRRLNVAQANNGILGFFLVATRAALNFRAIVGPLAGFIQTGLSKAFKLAEPVAAAFGKTLDGAKLAARPLVGLLASVTAGIIGLVGPSFIFVQIGTALAGVLGLIATALTSLAVPLAALTAGLGAIVGVVGFVAIPMIKWISDTKKLVDEKDELNKKIQTLDKSSKEYAQTQTRLNEIQKELNETGAEGVFRQLQNAGQRISNAVFTPENNQLFTNIIGSGLEALRPLLPILTKLVNVFATEVAKVADKFAEFTKNPRNLALILNFFESSAKLIQPMADGIGQLGKMFMLLGVAVAPIAQTMLKDFAGWLGDINERMSSPDGMRSLQGFFEKMYPVFRDLMALIGAFVGGIRDVGVALAPEFQIVIKWLREVGGQFVKWIIETVQKYGPDFAQFMKQIGNAIGIVWDIATKLYDAFKPLIELILGIIDIFLLMIRTVLKLAEIAHVADIVALAFRIILLPIRIVVEAVKAVFDWMNKLFTWVSESSVGQAIAAGFEIVADVLGKIEGFISKIIDGVKWLIENLPSWSKKMSDAQVAAYNNSVMGGGSNLPLTGASPVMQIPPSQNAGGGADRGNGASGAIVTRPTMALVGEAGPEAVVPLHATRGSRRLQMGSSGGVQISGDIHVHGVQNLNDFVNEVQKYISNLPRESGSEMSIG